MQENLRKMTKLIRIYEHDRKTMYKNSAYLEVGIFRSEKGLML